MSADNAFSQMTKDVLTAFSGAQAITFRGSSGDVSETGYLFQSFDYLGDRNRVGEKRWLCALQVSEVGNARRGDRVIDRNAEEWVLQERIEADEWMETWAVTKR